MCVQLQRIAAVQDVAGPNVQALSVDHNMVPFMHMLPELADLAVWADCSRGPAWISLSPLNTLPLKTLLVVGETTAPAVVRHLSHLTALTQLDFQDCQLADAGPVPESVLNLYLRQESWERPFSVPVSGLFKFQGQLQSLRLDPAYMHPSVWLGKQLSSLASLKRLRHLTLGVPCPAPQLAVVVLPELESLELELDEAYAEGQMLRSNWSGCQRLQRVQLGFHMSNESYGSGFRWIIDFSAIVGLRTLHLVLQAWSFPDNPQITGPISWAFHSMKLERGSASIKARLRECVKSA